MTRRIVVDASSMVSVLTDRGRRGEVAATALGGAVLCAPALLPFEVAHVLRGHEVGRRLGPTDAGAALAQFLLLPVDYTPLSPLATRVWELRHNLSAYDASYVALAEMLDVPLVTDDASMARAPGIRCEVIVPA